jgi:peptidoglycan/LPS O-acetylase OafA/YrhL
MATAKGRVAAAYFPLLDSLRGLAALGVFVLHIAFYLGLGTGTGVADYLVEHVSNFPPPSVVVFFALSGFVLYRPFALERYEQARAGTMREYTIRRAARILPIYWLVLVVTAVVLHHGYVFSASGVLRYFAFTQVYDGRTFNQGLPVAWSLDVDVAFYACLPLIVLVMRRIPARTRSGFLRTELLTCLLLYALSTAWQVLAVHLFLHQPRWLFAAELSLPGSLDIIVCGMALAVLSVAASDPPGGAIAGLIGERPWLPWLIAVLAYVLIGQIPGGFQHAHPILSWLLAKQLRCVLAVGALLPLIFGVGRGGPIRSVLATRPVRFLGTLSYGFYLWHLTVIDELARHQFRADYGAVAFVAVSLLITVLLATASWYGLERPVQRAARRWLAGRGPGREPASVLDAPASE